MSIRGTVLAEVEKTKQAPLMPAMKALRVAYEGLDALARGLQAIAPSRKNPKRNQNNTLALGRTLENRALRGLLHAATAIGASHISPIKRPNRPEHPIP